MKKMGSIIIWYYHRILPSDGKAAVSISEFEKQLGFLSRNGYEFIGTAELRLFLAGKLPPGRKYTMLTFDDGWGDNWIYATPLLAKFAAKAVLALNTGLVNEKVQKVRSSQDYGIVDSKTSLENALYRKEFSSFLTWPEIKEMLAGGIWEIQAHGNSHCGCYSSTGKIKGFYPERKHWTMEFALGEAPFNGAPVTQFAGTLAFPETRLDPQFINGLRNSRSERERMKIMKDMRNAVMQTEKDDEFIQRIRSDFNSCKEKIIEKTGKSPDCFFWPWGQSSEISRKIASECGFSLQFSTEKKSAAPGTDPLLVPRMPAPENIRRFKFRMSPVREKLLNPLKEIFLK